MGFNRNAMPEIRSGAGAALPDDPVVAMAYVPFQTDTATYEIKMKFPHGEIQALKAGTLFPVLDKPFRGRGMR